MKPPKILQLSALLRGATQLTRRGKLIEATAAIQRVLRGASAAPAEAPGRAVVVTPVLAPPLDTAAARAADAAAASVDAAVMLQPEDAAWNDVLSPDPVVEPVDPVVPDAPPPRRARKGAGVFGDGTFATAGGTRHYKLFVPGGAHDEPMPLIVMLHGCKQDPDDFAAGTRMNALAQEHGVAVLYPQQPPRSNAAKCWNWFNPGDQRRDAGEPALIVAMLRQVMATHAIDPARVYVAGLSAGGAMAAILAREYPDVFAAAGVHSGLAAGAAQDVMSAFAAMQRGGAGASDQASGAPLIVFHGDRDSTVHPDNGDQIVALRAAGGSETVDSGTAGRAFTRSVFSARDGRVQAEYWRVHGAGHAWSGGSDAGSYADPLGPDASREMLRFFLTQRLSSR